MSALVELRGLGAINLDRVERLSIISKCYKDHGHDDLWALQMEMSSGAIFVTESVPKMDADRSYREILTKIHAIESKRRK